MARNRPLNPACSSTSNPTKHFVKQMEKGNVRNAVRTLSQNKTKGVLKLNDTTTDASGSSECSVRDVLISKHPLGISPPSDILLQQDESHVTNPIIFEELNADLTLKAAAKTRGAAGLSG